MNISRPIVDIIRARQSCRSYSTRPLEPEKLQALSAYIDDINTILPIKARIRLVTHASANQAEPVKLGTYGVIAGASLFLAGSIAVQEEKAEILGYHLEKVILFATGLGLATCWLGGSFNRHDFQHALPLAADETLAVISPVGYGHEKHHLLDKMIRFIAKSDRRLPWSSLFFISWPDQPLDPEQAGDFRQALDMVRLGPSASNRQPWRVIKDKQGYHFYLMRTKGYIRMPYDMQRNDVGIAMCHFELTAQAADLPGKWCSGGDAGALPDQPDGMEYIATWRLIAPNGC